MQQCLRAVVLACCLCAARGQPQQTQEQSSDWLIWMAVILIVITTLAVWEAFKWVLSWVRDYCSRRGLPGRLPIGRVQEEDEQPDAEDDLAPPPPVGREQEREERERERLARLLVEQEAQQAFEEGLRRRGDRVYRPEPDGEPFPRPPSPPRSPRQQQGFAEVEQELGPEQPAIHVLRYADDVLIAGPAPQADQPQRDEVLRYADGGRPAEPPWRGEPLPLPPRARDIADVVQEVQQRRSTCRC